MQYFKRRYGYAKRNAHTRNGLQEERNDEIDPRKNTTDKEGRTRQYSRHRSMLTRTGSNVVRRFKACCFELVLWDAALIRFPATEEFLVSVWECQPEILRNFCQ